MNRRETNENQFYINTLLTFANASRLASSGTSRCVRRADARLSADGDVTAFGLVFGSGRALLGVDRVGSWQGRVVCRLHVGFASERTEKFDERPDLILMF